MEPTGHELNNLQVTMPSFAHSVVEMPSIRRSSTGERYRLYPGFTVGRGHRSSLYLPDRRVSGSHAQFHWNGTMWEVEDKSANGTFVDGTKMTRGTRKKLAVGSKLAFGNRDEMFEVVNARPPEPVAHAADGRVIFGEDGVLALPDAREPEYLVRQMGAGDKWYLESNRVKYGDDSPSAAARETEARPHELKNGEVIECRGVKYCLSLPMHQERTWRPDEDLATIDTILARMQASQSGAFVSMTIIHGNREISLRARAHGEVLLMLAEALVKDQQSLDLPEHERGWLVVEDVLHKLDISELQLNLYVHRARDQVKKAGVIDAKPRLIERRNNGQCRQIRLGVKRVEII